MRHIDQWITAGLLMLTLSATAVAGSVSGTITYEGKVPNMKEIKMDADPICSSKHTEPVKSEALVLGDGNTMANVLVSVKSGLAQKDFPVPTERVVLDQAGCTYTPHVFGVQAGQEIEILNPDGTLHNVHALSKNNPEFNMAMPKFKKKAVKKFEKPEAAFPIKCDVHPWMKTWCTVFDHPFFNVTGIDGKFIIEGLPAGSYEIEAWHEKLGARTATVKVGGDGDVQTSDFIFKRPSKK